jgi:predicted restriction endonuclease
LGRDNRHGLSINNEDIQKHDSKLTEHLVNVASESTDPTTITQLIEARRGQEKFRQNAIEVWGLGECCAVTGISIKPLLIASHIIPWRESDDTQRLSGTNGILLCSHLDKLFDQHLISFDSDGNLITSTALNEPDWNQLKTIGVDKSLRLNTEKLSPENAAEIAKNLKEHRDKLINF